MDNKNERRTTQRHKIQWPVSIITDGKTIEACTENITSNGMSITCDDPLPIDKVFRFYIIPPDHENIDITGKVVWSDLYGVDEENTTVGSGVCFVEVSEENSRYFNDILAEQVINQEPED